MPRNRVVCLIELPITITPFAGHYRKIRIHLRLSTINNAKTRSFTPRCIHLRKYHFQ